MDKLYAYILFYYNNKIYEIILYETIEDLRCYFIYLLLIENKRGNDHCYVTLLI